MTTGLPNPDAAPVREEATILSAFDSEWTYYVKGHDERELLGVDDPEVLEWTNLWMREIPASQAEDYGLADDDPSEYVVRDPVTGRFKARTLWVECAETVIGAEPWMGVKYAPAD